MSISRDHYTADACIIWCFDNRFWPAFQEFIKEQGYKNFDPVFCAGGAKNLGDPADPRDRDFVLKQIELSIKLHHTEKVVLMTHEDCGAFGGSKSFGNNFEKELARHKVVLTDAEQVVREKFFGLAVEKDIATFSEGVRSSL